MATPRKSGDSTQEREAATHHVEGSLEHVLAALELRDLDVDEREALDGAEVDARAGDVGEPRREDELGRRSLELPAQVADEVAAALGLAGDDHGVGVEVGRPWRRRRGRTTTGTS